jgi:hypothetical protein
MKFGGAENPCGGTAMPSVFPPRWQMAVTARSERGFLPGLIRGAFPRRRGFLLLRNILSGR